MNTREGIDVVLFDMGGVLVELGELEDFMGLPPSTQDFWPRWLASPAVRAFERGHSTAAEFGSGLVAEFNLGISAQAVVERFGQFPRGLFDGAAELVNEVHQLARTAVLSNTNAIHWENQIDGEQIRSLFDEQFLSYEMGLVKPDIDLFHAVVDQLGTPASKVLFVDDNQINVDGAAEAGIVAHLAKGVAETRQVLSGYGLAQPHTDRH